MMTVESRTTARLHSLYTFNLTSHLGIAGKQGKENEREKGNMEEKQ
jgi:hypothetical protein